MPWMPSLSDARWTTIQQQIVIARWPEDQSNRVNAHFRMITLLGLPDAHAERHVFRIAPDIINDIQLWGYIDIEFQEPFLLGGNTGLDADGRNVQLIVKQYTEADPHPLFGPRIMERRFTISRAPFTDTFISYLFGFGPILGQGKTPFNWSWDKTNRHSSNMGAPGTEWEDFLNWEDFQGRTISTCYDLEQAAPLPLFIAGNGTDAYVQNDQVHSQFFSSFKISAQVRFRDFTNAILLCSSTDASHFLGIFGTDLKYRTITIALSPLPALNQFGEFVFERARTPPGEIFRVFWEGSEIGSGDLTFDELDWDRMAGNRPTPTPEWGDLDMRDVLISGGLPPGESITFDMDAAIAACDVGPQTIKGTTFNMSLPSCP